MIVRSDDSQWLESARKLPAAAVKTTFHETVLLVATVVAVFVVFLVAGEAALVSGNVSAALSTVPVQLALSYSVNDSVPLIGVPLLPAVTVPESFGNQSWADVLVDVSVTVKHSFAPLSLDGL